MRDHSSSARGSRWGFVESRSGFRILAVVACAGLWLLVAGRVEAQLQVEFTPAKKVYIAHEAIVGVLRLTNNAGRDIVLGGKAGGSWLDFQVTNPRNHLLAMRGDAVLQPPIVLRNNQPFEITVVVNRNYSMGETGMYRIKPSVYFPPVDRYYSTKPMSIQVTDGKPFWEQPFGVPPGRPGAGTYREYALINLTNTSEKQLYVRLTDKASGIVMTTFSLGKLITARPPTYGVDAQNRMHVLHMAAPQTYAHVVVDVDGSMLSRDMYYEENSNRPALVTIAGGLLGVQGGIGEEEHQTPYEQRAFRKLSELPPGMPLLPVP